MPSEMIAIGIAIIRHMSGTTDNPKAAPQVREMTKHRSKPKSIEGLTMEIKRKSEEGAAGDDPSAEGDA